MNAPRESENSANLKGESPAPESSSSIKAGGIVLRIILPIIILTIGGVGYQFLSQKPKSLPSPPPSKKKLEVEAEPLNLQDYQIIVKTQGEVRAHSQVPLTAQVGGRVEVIHPEFEDGAFFKKGDILIELNEVDFEVAVIAAESQLAQAELFLAQEETRGNQAELNWQDLGYEGEANDLVLRKPHLKQAKNSVKLAEAQLESAKRNLERSKVKAPFDGRVLIRNVGIGQTVGASTPLGTIFATGYSEVRLPVSTRALKDLTLPEDITDPPLEVTLHDGLNEDSGNVWKAKILRTEGALDASTLELFAIARIEDPFGVKSGSPPLRIGQPVIAAIPGTILEDVYVIPRETVTGLSRIRIADPEDFTLGTAIVSPIASDEDHIVVRNPYIKEGTLLLKTRLVYAPDGGTVEVINPDEGLEELAESSGTSTNKFNKPTFGSKKSGDKSGSKGGSKSGSKGSSLGKATGGGKK